jgi:hypothetical protein
MPAGWEVESLSKKNGKPNHPDYGLNKFTQAHPFFTETTGND